MSFNTVKNISLPILLLLFFSACSGGGGEPILVDDGGGSGNAGNDTVAPSAPANLKVEGVVQSDSVSITWDASSDNVGVNGYRVFRDSNLLTETTQTRYTDNGVSGSQTYQYQVVAFDAAQNTATSRLMVNTPAEVPPADTEPPTAPTNLRLLGEPVATSVSIEWDAATDNVRVIGYRILRDDVVLTQGIISETNYTDNGVAASASYEYRVEAVDEAQNATSTSALMVNTPAEIPPGDTEPPSSPANLRVLGVLSTTSVAFEWDASTDDVGVIGYRVLRDDIIISTGVIAETNYTDNSVNASTTYEYRVEAMDQAQNVSPPSVPLPVTTPEVAVDDTEPPSRPANLRLAGNPSSVSISIIWDASTDNVGVAGYRVFRSVNSNAFDVIDVIIENAFTDTAVSAGQAYRYEIVAFDQALNNAFGTNVLSVTTPNTPPPPDTTAPNVTSVLPADNASQVSVNISVVSVDFDEAIDPNSINVANFSLDNGVTGTVSTANGDTQALLTPSVPLNSSTTYKATLSGVTDIAGNALAGNNNQSVFTWSFTTCGGSLTSTYTISWDAVNDADLSGYRVYYDTASPLTKTNAASIDLPANATSWIMDPNDLGFQLCDTVTLAVTALSTVKNESAFSNKVNQLVE